MQRRMWFLQYHIQVTERVFITRLRGNSGAASVPAVDAVTMEEERRMLSACGATILAPGPNAGAETLKRLFTELKR